MTQTMGPAEVTKRFQDAWNTHNMEAFGRLFHSDATFVNRFGTYWRGVDQIVAGHASIHASIYRDSTLVIDARDVDLSRTTLRSCISGHDSAPARPIRPGRIRSTH
jgi:uncharacterized protein (TIGR02246 family)